MDFEKSFDNVNWGCVDTTLARFGFGYKWRSWIKWCITTPRFVVILKGEATKLFRSQKGIRQGDRISPFLFILVAEVLSLMFKSATNQVLISGFKVAEQGTMISQLHFADDIIVFLDDNETQVQNLKSILMAFETISSLKVNYRKSTIVGLGHLYNGDVCADIFRCSSTNLPMNYLGIQLGSKSKCRIVGNEVIQKFQQKLSGWKRTHLSKRQRLVMIQSVLSSLSVYYMTMFQIPSTVAKELDRLCGVFCGARIQQS